MKKFSLSVFVFVFIMWVDIEEKMYACILTEYIDVEKTICGFQLTHVNSKQNRNEKEWRRDKMEKIVTELKAFFGGIERSIEEVKAQMNYNAYTRQTAEKYQSH